MALPANVAELNAMIAAAVAHALQQLPQQQQQQPQQPAFARNPGGQGNLPWDFSTSQGIKVYQAATAPFLPAYDGEGDKLPELLRKVRARTQEYGFHSILLVNDNGGTPRDLSREHGCITIANVQTKARGYLGQEQRDFQASGMLFTLVMNSVTPRLAGRLEHRSSDYNLDMAAAGAAPDVHADGPCLLHSLIKLINVDTRCFLDTITEKLSDMVPIMDKAKSNIAEFNAAIDKLIDALISHDARIPDIIPQLFKAYKACADEKFVTYITAKQDSYLDRTLDFTYATLMQLALEKFKTIGEDKWCQKSPRELEFIAMQGKILKLEQNPKSTKPPRGGGGATDTDKKNRNQGKFAWKGIAPKPSEPQEKTVNGKVYIYCPNHGDTKWVLKTNLRGLDHKTNCSKKPPAQAPAPAAAGNGGHLTAALANLAEEENEEETI
jgi:hypothetical protein